MKDDIRNIINFEDITRVRSSIGASVKLPKKNTIVKLVPLEFLEQGVKVLIDGRLFIAFLDEKIPLKEEIVAFVIESNPFSLSLGLSSILIENESEVINEVIKKLELPNTKMIRKIIVQVIEEGNILIKSKILMLSELLGYIKVSGLELSLLINLVWYNNDKQKDLIEDLYYGLFDDKFEVVCNHLSTSINNLLFSNLPQYLIKTITATLIYSEKRNNLTPFQNKVETILNLIKLLNDYNISANKLNESIDAFVQYGIKYILQKSMLKEYDYYPDFVLVEKGTSLILVNYSIKKIIDSQNEVRYKIEFTNKDLPFKLTGILRDKLLVGNTIAEESIFSDEEINSLNKSLYNNWGIRSDIKLNSDNRKGVVLPKLDKKINKLVS